MIKKTTLLLLSIAAFSAFASFAFAQDYGSDFDFDQYEDQYLYQSQPQNQAPEPKAVIDTEQSGPAEQPQPQSQPQMQSRNPLTIRPYVGIKGAVSIAAASFDMGSRDYDSGFYPGYGYYGYYNSWTDDSSDTVFTGLASAGLKINNFRLEFEYSQRTKAYQSFSFFPPVNQEFRSYMFNFMFEAPPVIRSNIAPYGGLGLGVTHVNNEFNNAKDKEQDMFSISGDFGLSFLLTNHVNFDAGLKLWYLGGMTLYNQDFYMFAFDFYLGLRYTI